MTEEWRDVIGYEGLYKVSNTGKVLSVRRNLIMKQSINEKGYYRVGLSKDNKEKHYRVHRLVAQAFIPNPNNCKEINHIDEDKSNNNADNLEWCTRVQNMNHGTVKERISENNSLKIRCLCVETQSIYESLAEAAKATKQKSYTCISEVLHGKRKQAGGYHWQYV